MHGAAWRSRAPLTLSSRLSSPGTPDAQEREAEGWGGGAADFAGVGTGQAAGREHIARNSIGYRRYDWVCGRRAAQGPAHRQHGRPDTANPNGVWSRGNHLGPMGAGRGRVKRYFYKSRDRLVGVGKFVSTLRPPGMWWWSRAPVQVQNWSISGPTGSRSRKLVH